MAKKGFSGIVRLFVGITLAVVLAANVAIPTITGVNTTNWSTGARALWLIVDLAVVVLIILTVLG